MSIAEEMIKSKKSTRMQKAITNALGTTSWTMKSIHRVSTSATVVRYEATILETRHLFEADIRISFSTHRGVEASWI